ncbi:MAG: peptidylprolyl isomerase, partial [Bacteroidales bacterium]|nr:peptidylprolyl isomerase [Bacteroidales bacterium]
ESGPMNVTVGKSDIEPGLDEGLRMIKPGGKAIFILPPFLAHGLVGDGNKIPPRTIVVYWITLAESGQME